MDAGRRDRQLVSSVLGRLRAEAEGLDVDRRERERRARLVRDAAGDRRLLIVERGQTPGARAPSRVKPRECRANARMTASTLLRWIHRTREARARSGRSRSRTSGAAKSPVRGDVGSMDWRSDQMSHGATVGRTVMNRVRPWRTVVRRYGRATQRVNDVSEAGPAVTGRASAAQRDDAPGARAPGASHIASCRRAARLTRRRPAHGVGQVWVWVRSSSRPGTETR